MLRALRNLRGLNAPPRGWISETRNIIGMRADQLAKRMGVTQSTVSEMEHAEASGSITLNSLRKAAGAMECRLVYAFVPEKSFEDVVMHQAERAARAQLRPVSHSMALENQQTGSAEQQELLTEYVTALVRYLPRDLWDTDE
jgi:predicted DNA-binding mobile mystery protein A